MRIAKKIKIIVIIAVLLMPAVGWALDASHTNTPGYNIQCGSCHWTNASATPPWENAQVPDAPDNTINNRRCYVCHDGTNSLISGAKTHSTSTTSNTYWTTQGGWKTECVTCHNPHEQRQTSAWGAATYLEAGTAPTIGLYDNTNNWTPITFTASLPAGTNYNGYYLKPDKNYPFYYKIVEPDTRGLTTIKVKGQVLTAYVKTGGYAIVYGKNVKDSITYTNPGLQAVGGQVRLYRPSGIYGPADAASISTSVCYVCHTQQNHYSSKPGADTSHNAGTDCESCHKHMQGFKPACDVCHGNPPTVAAQTPPNGLVWVTVAGGSGTGTGSTTAGAHNTHVNTINISCDFCHYNSVGSGVTHNAGSVTLGFKGFGGSSGGGAYNGQSGVTYNATATTPATSVSSGGLKQCSNVYCHGSTMASNGGSNTSPTWDVTSTGACGTCHGADSANPPQLGSHVEHTSASTGYSFTCTLCHNTAAGTHVNGKVEWAFNTGDTRTNGGQYNSAASGTTNTPAPSGTYQSCSNLYCHSIVQTPTGGALTGAAGEYKTPTWGTAWDRSRTNASTLCSNCHQYRTLSSGSHLKHVGDTIGNYRYHCGKCHYDNTCGDCHSGDMNTLIMSPAVHVNGQVDVKLWSTVIDGTYSGTPTPGDGSFGNCTNLYCHSKGTVATGAFEAPNVTPTWGGTLPSDCTGCHSGDRNASTSMSTGSHTTHVTSSGIDCAKCHTGTVTDSRTLYDRNQHVNPDSKAVNIKFDTASNPSGTATYNGSPSPVAKTPGTAYGACSNLYCHGTASPVWGGTLASSCDSCHSGQGAGTAVTKNYTTAHSSKHTGTYLLACENCHTLLHSNTASRTTHAGGPASPPQTAEVKFTDQTGSIQYGGGGSSFRYANLYANPYGAAAPSPGYTAGASAGTDPNNASITWTAGSCSNVWCHSNANPAGGTNSYSSPAWNSAIDCGSCHRKPDTAANMAAAGTPAQMSVSHVKHIATDQYGLNSNFTCNSCHTNTASDSSTISNTANHVNGSKNVALNTWAGGSFATNQCSNVYCHSQGTSATAPPAPNVPPTWGGSLDPNATGTNCEGCHGAKYGGGYVNTMNTNVHDAHINPTTVDKRGTNYGCSECHNATMSGTGMSIGNYANHVNKLVNIQFMGTAPHVNRDTDAPTYNGSATTGANGATKAVGTAVGNCANVYCHSVGNLNSTGDVVAVGSPAVGFRTMTWSTATSIGCDGCHGNQAGKAHPVYASGPAGSDTANSHVKHVEGSAITCDTCHTTTTASTTIPPTSVIIGGTHLDRQETVAFKNIGGSTGLYNAGKTCSSTYCHGTGPSPAWGGSTNCATCHEASQALAGAHSKHYATATTAGANTTGRTSDAANYIFNCGTCHDPSVTHHAQGPANTTSGRAAEISFNVSWATGFTGGAYTEGGTIATDSKGFKYSTDNTCTNVYCHSDGKPLGAANPTYRTVTWNQAPATPNCGICHDAVPATNAHTKHASTYGFGCVKCHSATVSDNTTIANKDNHVNFVKDVAWDATNTGGDAYASPNCSNIYCHSKGQANVAPYNNAGNTPNIAPAWNGTLNTECTGCHNGDASATGGLTMNTNSHTAHVNNATVIGNNFTCDVCHSATVAAGQTRVIGTVSNHVNKQINVAFTALNPNPAAYSGTTTPGDAAGNCSSVYCHSTGNLSAPTASLPSPQYGAAGSQSHYTQMQWGGSAIGCTGCHGKSTTTGAPDYTNAGAGNPGANSHPKHTAGGSATCQNCHSATTTTGTSIIAGSLHLNGARDVVQGNGKTFNYAQVNQTCSSISCHFNGTAQWGATLQCSACHSSLSGAHGVHTSITGALYGSTSVSTTGGVYNFGCGNCHPVNPSSHADGTVEISLNPADGGTLKALNSPSANRTGSALTSVCNLTYCHSDGTKTGAAIVSGASPAWSGYTGTDRCAMCHLNSPNTGSHQNHVMAGIHYDDIFTGTTGLAVMGNTATGAHGNAATATTLNCNICHYGTVTTAANDKNLNANANCGSCHNGTTAPLKGNVAIDAASNLHLNGVIDVQLKTGAVLSRAQLRNDANTASGAPAGWSRNVGYKASGAYDSATINSGDWVSGTKTCLTACHLNQSSPAWGTPTTCNSCHATLPQ